MNTILFGVAAYLLHKNKPSLRWPLFLSALAMFLISTATVAITLYITFGLLFTEKVQPLDIGYPQYIFYVVNR
jgi:hypothetical protein